MTSRVRERLCYTTLWITAVRVPLGRIVTSVGTRLDMPIGKLFPRMMRIRFKNAKQTVLYSRSCLKNVCILEEDSGQHSRMQVGLERGRRW